MSKPVFHNFDRFCSKLIVNSKEFGVRPLVPMWNTQRWYVMNILRAIERNIRFLVTNKARQGGITTIDLAILIFWMNKFAGTLAAMISDDGSNLARARGILTKFMNHLPAAYHVGHDRLGHHNNFELELDNSSLCSYLIAGKKKKLAESGDLGQGKGINFLIATEVASWADPKQVDKLVDSLAEHHPNRLYLFESTANGFNHWYDMCKAAENATTQAFIFIGWWLHDLHRCEKGSDGYRVYWDGTLTTEERRWIREVKQIHGADYRELMKQDLEITPEQIAWYRLQLHEKKRGDLNALYQEHPPTSEMAFIMSGYKFFSSERLTQAYKDAMEMPFEAWRYTFGQDFVDLRLHKTNAVGAQLKIWEHPVPGGVYVLGGDPAYGYNPESDQSVTPIYRCYADRMIQVAEFCSPGIRTDQFAWVILHLVGWYKNVLMNLEITGPGQAVLTELRSVQKRQNLLASRGERNFADTQSCMKHFLYSRQDALKQSFNFHTKTTEQEKEDMMNNMKAMFETERLLIRSALTVNEMKYFCRAGGTLQGMGGEYDDRVIGTALAVLAYIRWIRPQLSAQNLTYAIVSAAESSRKTQEQGMVIDFLKERGVKV
jgi:hypothetical protein